MFFVCIREEKKHNYEMSKQFFLPVRDERNDFLVGQAEIGKRTFSGEAPEKPICIFIFKSLPSSLIVTLVVRRS